MDENSENKKKTGRRIKTSHIVFIVVLLVFGLLIAAAIYLNRETLGNGSVIRSEIMYTIMVLAILLPVLILITALALFSRGNGRKSEVTVNMTKEPAPVSREAVPVSVNVPVMAAEDMAAFDDGKTDDGESGVRFPTLCEIDRNRFLYKKTDYDETVTLSRFCDDFRNFAAGAKGLYYDIKDIRQFVAGMAVSNIIILQGMSGTGKTSLACAFGDFVDNPSTVISVQPMWKERTDLIGYFNEFTKKFSEQQLLLKMYEANYSRDIYITVLDEMNIARVEYYFAEFLSQLELPEAERRKIKVVTSRWDEDPLLLDDEGQLQIPGNMWYVGTANNDDSTFSISDKVYDRAMIMDLDRKAEVFKAEEPRRDRITSERFRALADEALKEYRITGRNRRRLRMLDRYMMDNFKVTFGNRIMMQIEKYIPIYVACGGTELEALDEILSKKVIRKLSMQNPITVRNGAPGLIDEINRLFGDENMEMCKDRIRQITGTV